MSLCRTDVLQIADKEIAITLMYSQSSQKILFVEAEKDFVDVLVGFLALPICCAIKVLFENALVTSKTVGAIANVLKSVQRIEAEETHKNVLTDRKPGYGAKCPRHQKKMTTQCTVVHGNDTASIDGRHDCVKDGKYFVTDSLEIFPSSQSLVLLQELNVENMSSLYSIDIQVDVDEIFQLLRSSLRSGIVLNDVFGKSIRDGYVLTAPHQDIISQHNCKPRKFINLLQKGGQVLEDVPVKDAMEVAHDWGRRLYSAFIEIQDTALYSSLVKYVKEREKRISSALRDLSFLALNATSHSSRSSSNGTGTRHNKNNRAKRSDLMPKPCKEMLMLEKQVDKMIARLCCLTSLGPSPDPPIGARKPKSPAAGKPPWTMYEKSSRIRLPFRG